ncbi:Hsp20/alpha crystallin family protein [Candidatus Gribaldobacteria bacterium]|nr:Hsp20/alpha crystallin family protein [Candidatus Gribaldobacteria bacterium]
MAFFKKLKNNLGVEEENKTTDREEKKPKKEKVKFEEKEVETKTEKEEKTEKDDKKKDSHWLQSKGQLAADIYETEDEFCILAPVAGVSQDEIEIFVENEMLIIKSERKEPDADKEKKYFFKECYFGPFSRQVILPEDANSQKIKASFKKGILLVSMPKKKTEKKKIEIEIE